MYGYIQDQDIDVISQTSRIEPVEDKNQEENIEDDEAIINTIQIAGSQ